ncbi:MAG TPA: hypothetical protein VKN36_11455 [Eudoraea sp.]|nr:hypothetical protein [Eudoraea sp.]
MKRKYAIVLTNLVFIIAGCSKNTDTSGIVPLNGRWNLVNVSGGFAGINEDFEEGTIVWNFEAATGTLTIENNNTSDALYDGLPSGSYQYSILTDDKNLFLYIDNRESGAIFTSLGEIVLDQNVLSNGNGADLFVLTLRK